MVLAAQILWSEDMDKALQTMETKGGSDQGPIEEVLGMVEASLNVLADSVLHEQPPVRRMKMEQMVCVVSYSCLLLDPGSNPGHLQLITNMFLSKQV